MAGRSLAEPRNAYQQAPHEHIQTRSPSIASTRSAAAAATVHICLAESFGTRRSARGRIHVQRTYSEKGGRIEPCKDGEDRWVKASPALLTALRDHLAAVELEGQVKDWTREPQGRRNTGPASKADSLHRTRPRSCKVSPMARTAVRATSPRRPSQPQGSTHECQRSGHEMTAARC